MYILILGILGTYLLQYCCTIQFQLIERMQHLYFSQGIVEINKAIYLFLYSYKLISTTMFDNDASSNIINIELEYNTNI